MSPYPYTSPSSRSSTSMDSGHDSPFHSSNVNQNVVDQAQNYYSNLLSKITLPLHDLSNFYSI